ncbi:MAG: hypothetical protein WD535_05450, partial [Thermaerobacterales bacterium]
VRARLREDRAEELARRLVEGEFESIRPFGTSLARSLNGARRDPETQDALWEEECYCSPPLAMERAEVLDRYFAGIITEAVSENTGWQRIAGLPSLW